jgi:predicted ATPase
MLISISGTQGSGKTTILNEIKRLGYGVIERKTSRSILADWNITLNEVYSNRELSIKFQDELLVRKQADELDAITTSKQLWFTERSYADLFAYTLITNGWANQCGDWLNTYYESCKEANKKYNMIFFINPFDSTTNSEDDGVRGINKHYSQLVDNTIQNTLANMSFDPLTLKYNVDIRNVDSQYIDERVRMILRLSHDLWIEKTVPAPTNRQ